MKMTEKRHRKVYGALKDLPLPEEFTREEIMDVGIIAWGSTFGSALEATRKAQKGGFKVGALKITSIFPFHAALIRRFMERCREILIPELNYEGQLANVIGHLHRKEVIRLNRATGTPMPASMIYEKIEAML
jgi:2-oxoglutarate ferredoxin oxidoreductase subunit alpha